MKTIKGNIDPRHINVVISVLSHGGLNLPKTKAAQTRPNNK